jgi:hypothetical protein
MVICWSFLHLRSSGSRRVKLTGLQAPKWHPEVVTPFWRSAVLSLLFQVAQETHFQLGQGRAHSSQLSYTYTYHWACTPVPKIGLHTDCDSWLPLVLSYLLHTGEVTRHVLGPHTHQAILPLAVWDWWSGPFECRHLSCHSSWLPAIDCLILWV